MKKASGPQNATHFEQIPNVGPATAGDFRELGITKPQQLVGQDAFKLYERLCKKTKTTHDPCVIDVFLAAIAFMETGDSRPWWEHTADRKNRLRNKDV
ncbi:MAG: helix-hairpin-helix domain-containing protein [Pirellulaceae bacterium]